jgi:hypothetical protein
MALMKRIAQTIVTMLLAPFGIAMCLLVFGVLGIIAIPLSVRSHFEHRRWLKQMRRSKRTLTPTEIVERGGSGTLIVDQPGWGGKAKYCWWTPDNIDSLAPLPITPLADRIESLNSRLDADDLPLDRWIYDTYLSPDSGTAYLVTTKRGDLVASQLYADMVNLNLIETWSAPVREFGAQNAG